MPSQIIRVVIALFIYFTSIFCFGRLVNAAAYLTARLGSPGLWINLHGHPYGRSILLGLIAGLVPLRVWLGAGAFFSADVPEFLAKLELERMKRWIVVWLSPIMVLEVLKWIVDWHLASSREVGVLSDNPSIPISQMFDGFFSTQCQNILDSRLELWNDNFDFQCMLHIQTISSYLTAVGYSLATWVGCSFFSDSRGEAPKVQVVDESARLSDLSMPDEEAQ